MLSIFKKLFSSSINYRELLDRGGVIIDVRSPAEFNTGHIHNSINIPLDQIPQKTTYLKKLNKPVITVCRSGNRSGMAKVILNTAGVQVYNGGAWNSLQQKIR